MAFTKITDADLQGKGVVGQAPVPGLPVKEMQESVEQIVREVAIPGINRLADELSAQTAAKNIGMQVPDGMPGGASANVSSVVGTHVLSTGNPHKVTAEQVGAYTKEQTDQAINQKVQDIGAGDMSKSEYARTGTYGAVDRALSADRAVQSDDGVKVYTHTKSGTVHNFAGSGPNGRAKMTADVQAGDTFTVNGAPVTAYMGTDDAAGSMAGSAWNGKWVSFIVEGGTLNFKGGSAGQNYRVNVSSALPPTAAENTVWVESGENTTRYSFSSTAPTSINGDAVRQGDIWIKTGVVSLCAFNAARRNVLMICPVGAYQYNASTGAWDEKKMAVRLSGQWVYPYQDVTLYDNGYVNAELIGGFNLYPLSGGFGTPTVWEQQSTFLAIYTEANTGAKAGSFVTQKAVDLTGYKNIEVSVTNVYTSSPMCRLAVFSEVSNPLVIDNAAAQVAMTQNGTFELDVSSLQGDYFVVYYCGNTSFDQAAAGANVTSIKMTV